MKPAYYNEIDEYCSQWLRNLIAKGLIPDGEVDSRSIRDVHPDDVREFQQCHWFAGIGGFGLACRLAGWPDDQPIWTGGPPCQPFSVAGRQLAQQDDRHLWPEMHRLIAQVRPSVVIIENVAGIVPLALDGIQFDLDSCGYASRAFVVPACAVDAPHRRDRVWIAARNMADAEGGREPRQPGEPDVRGALVGAGIGANGGNPVGDRAARSRANGGHQAHSSRAAAHTQHGGCEGQRVPVQPGRPQQAGADTERAGGRGQGSGAVADAVRPRSHARALPGVHCREEGPGARHGDPAGCRDDGFWDNAGWIVGRDGKARRVPQSGVRQLADGLSAGMVGVRSGDAEEIPLLAHGVPDRVGKLRAFGNAIVPQVAAEIIRAIRECTP